jgi:hypothetical protein
MLSPASKRVKGDEVPARIVTEDKKCQQCGQLFNRGRLRSGRIEAIGDYDIRKFCSHTCHSRYNTKEHHWFWKGGIKTRPDGYIRRSEDDKYEHRIILESYLGRKLNSSEFTHHKNGDTSDNRVNNLEVMTNSEHAKLHSARRKRDAKGRLI